MDDYRPIHKSMGELCNELITKGWMKSKKVYDVMMSVDRADFSPTNPYENNPQCIGYNVVISAPLLHSYCLEVLKDFLTEGSTALDIGFGSGYLSVAMSKMMNDKGRVIGIEHIKDLYDFGINNIKKHHSNLINNKCIHVGASANQVPNEILEQLAFGGRLVMPLGPREDQYIYIIDKDLKGNINYTKGLCVKFVPLTSVKNQLNNIE